MLPTKSITRTAQTLLLAAALASPAAAQTEFTYQGVLSDGSGPVTGTENIRFRLYDAPVGGTLFGETTQNVDVAEGVFTAPLNLGTLHTIDPTSAWLEIAVSTGGGSFDTLGRQKITAAPFAMNTRGLFVDEDNFVGLGDVYLQGDTVPFKLSVRDADAAIFVQSDPGSDASMHWMSDSSFFSTIYAPTGSNDLRVNHEGTGDVVAITNAGRVGIGTNSPSHLLDVRGSLRIGDGTTNSQDIDFFSQDGAWQVGTNSPVGGGGVDNNIFYIYDTSTTNYALTVTKGSNRVGIGTFAPAGTFHVQTPTGGAPSFIVGDTGNVGIGLNTNQLAGALNINGDSYLLGDAVVTGRTSSNSLSSATYRVGDTFSGQARIRFDSAFNSVPRWEIVMDDGDFDALQIKNLTTPGLPVMEIDNETGNIGINGFAPADYTVAVNGEVCATAFLCASSRALKDDITPIESALALVDRLEGVTYTWNESAPEDMRGQHAIGFIAEDVAEVLPTIVATDDDGYAISIDYAKMTPVAIQAIKELKGRHDDAVASLQADNDALRVRLERLELMLDTYARNTD